MADGETSVPEAMSHGHDTDPQQQPMGLLITSAPAPDLEPSPISPRAPTPNPFSRHNSVHGLDLDGYFVGPRDLTKFSKWPIFLQLKGSILPEMVLPLFWVGAWATLIVLLDAKTSASLGISNILLTVTGFVVAMGLSLRSSTAYERYGEGRRYWEKLIQTCHSLGRCFWIHVKEREGELGRKDLLAKLTAMNLLVTFSVALKHKLRFEPYTSYEDLESLVTHLDTFAQAATREEPEKAKHHLKRHGFFKQVGEYLGVSFAASNPRKAIKKAERPLGNLPLEILTYLAAFTDEVIANGQMTVGMQQTTAYNGILALNDVLTGTERVLTTPLPIAYAIAIQQITWVYIALLPFQLLPTLGYVTIPASVAAAYIILGILFIGREIENPFGQDVNDLPLESFCAQIAAELDVIASRPKPRNCDWIETSDNRVMWPLSQTPWNVWMHRSEAKVRDTLRAKVELGYERKREADEGELRDGIEANGKTLTGRVTVDSV